MRRAPSTACVFVSLVALKFSGACIAQVAPASDPVETDRDFAALALDSGTRAAYERYLADDAVLFRPLAVGGRDWLATHEPASGRLEWTPTDAFVACDRSLAITLGTWTYTPLDLPARETGQYLTAWRPQAGGAWRVALDQSIERSDFDTIVARLHARDASTCRSTAPKAGRLEALERQRNATPRTVRIDAAEVVLRSVGTGRVFGGRRSDLALSYGELFDPHSSGTANDAVRAVYVRVWNRVGRDWQVVAEVTTPVPP
jgi:hypothetical protein